MNEPYDWARENDEWPLWDTADALDALIERVKRISCDDPKPPWWNQEEENVDYTSATAFALLGVVLGNTLGIDLKPLLRQTWAIKTCEDNLRDEDD